MICLFITVNITHNQMWGMNNLTQKLSQDIHPGTLRVGSRDILFDGISHTLKKLGITLFWAIVHLRLWSQKHLKWKHLKWKLVVQSLSGSVYMPYISEQLFLREGWENPICSSLYPSKHFSSLRSSSISVISKPSQTSIDFHLSEEDIYGFSWLEEVQHLSWIAVRLPENPLL